MSMIPTTEKDNKPQPTSPSPVVGANNAQSTPPPTKSYVDHFMAHSSYQPMTAEERAKVQKRERAKGIISAVGDGISSLANLYATTQYAPNVEQSQLQLSERNRQRWERVNAQREAQRKEFEAGYQRALAMDKDQADKDRNYNLRVDLAGREQAHRDKAFEYGKERDAKQFDFQKERAGRQDAQWDMSFKRQGDNDKFSQEMQRKQLGLQQARLNLERQQAQRAAGGRGAGGAGQPYHSFVLQNGAVIPVSRDRLNAGNVEVLWRRLPDQVRKQYERQINEIPIKIPGQSEEALQEVRLQRKLEAIGNYAYDTNDVDFLNRIAQIAGSGADLTSKKRPLVLREQESFRDINAFAHLKQPTQQEQSHWATDFKL